MKQEINESILIGAILQEAQKGNFLPKMEFLQKQKDLIKEKYKEPTLKQLDFLIHLKKFQKDLLTKQIEVLEEMKSERMDNNK